MPRHGISNVYGILNSLLVKLAQKLKVLDNFDPRFKHIGLKSVYKIGFNTSY